MRVELRTPGSDVSLIEELILEWEPGIDPDHIVVVMVLADHRHMRTLVRTVDLLRFALAVQGGASIVWLKESRRVGPRKRA